VRNTETYTKFWIMCIRDVIKTGTSQTKTKTKTGPIETKTKTTKKWSWTVSRPRPGLETNISDVYCIIYFLLFE
jgi:hypothetical protein